MFLRFRSKDETFGIRCRMINPFFMIFSTSLAPTANHVLLALSRVLLSESLRVRILHGSAESEFLQDLFQRNPLLATIQIPEHAIDDGIPS